MSRAAVQQGTKWWTGGRSPFNASYGKDNDLLLGTPQFDGFDEERFAGSIRNTFQFTTERADTDPGTAPELRPSQVYALMVAAAAGVSDSRLTAPPELRAQTESGQILFLLLETQQSLRSKLRPREQRGVGEVQLLWNATAKKAFKAGPFAGQTGAKGGPFRCQKRAGIGPKRAGLGPKRDGD